MATNDRNHKIGIEWPKFGGLGANGRLVLVGALLLLTHLKYPNQPLDSWLNLLVGVFAGLGVSPHKDAAR